MPFGMVSGVGRGMSVLDRGGHRRMGRSSLGVEFGAFIATNWDSATLLWAVLVKDIPPNSWRLSLTC